MTKHRLAWLLTFVLCVGSLGHASAESERETLIETGLQLRQQARDEEALGYFERAAQIQRDGRVLAQIAFAEQGMGRWAESYMHLNEALADMQCAWIQEHHELLQQELAKIEGNIGRLDVRTNVAVAKLTVDGKEVGTTPLSEPLVVTAGAVVVSAHATGYLSTTRRVPVHAGSLSRTELTLVPEPSIQANAATAGKSVHRRTSLLYVAGAGALVSVAAIGPWIRSSHLMNDLTEHCSAPGSCSGRVPRDPNKVDRLDKTTTGLLIGGLSTAAVAGAFYWLWPQRERPTLRPTASVSFRSVVLGATYRF